MILGKLQFKHYKMILLQYKFRDYPRPDGRMRTMLFNDAALELSTYMEGEVEKL